MVVAAVAVQNMDTRAALAAAAAAWGRRALEHIHRAGAVVVGNSTAAVADSTAAADNNAAADADAYLLVAVGMEPRPRRHMTDGGNAARGTEAWQFVAAVAWATLLLPPFHSTASH